MNTVKVQVGQIYRHFRTGVEYAITGFAIHTETMESLVLYKAVDATPEEPAWARPASMFNIRVAHGGVEVPRFMLIQEAPVKSVG